MAFQTRPVYGLAQEPVLPVFAQTPACEEMAFIHPRAASGNTNFIQPRVRVQPCFVGALSAFVMLNEVKHLPTNGDNACYHAQPGSFADAQDDKKGA